MENEPDEDTRIYMKAILQDLAAPEKSRLESSTDLFDSLEDYEFNILHAYGMDFENSEVYFWLVWSKRILEVHEAYEMCYNIQKAIDIIRSWQLKRKQDEYKI